MEDIVFAPAHVQAARVRERSISAVELIDAHLAQIARHNPQVNAVVTLDAEAARQRAQAADAALARNDVWGPLHGVPFTAKDALETEDLPTSGGWPLLEAIAQSAVLVRMYYTGNEGKQL